MDKWYLIQEQPKLRVIFKEPPLISYRKGKSVKDMLVKSETLKAVEQHNGHTAGVAVLALLTPILVMIFEKQVKVYM